MIGEPPRTSDQIALYTYLQYVSPNAPVLIESRALRRPEVLVRRIRYLGITLHERLLSNMIDEPPRPGRMQAMLLLRGELFYGSPQLLEVGSVLLAHPHHRPLFRYRDAELLQLEWDTEQRVELPTPLRRCIDATDAAAVFDKDPPTDQRASFRVFLEAFRRAGVGGLDCDVDRMVDGTTPREVRMAATLTQQLQGIRRADAAALGEFAGLSPRQLQRLYASFYSKYGFGLGSWRDTRNAWRVMLAALLLSRHELTVAQIADEVGYSSSPALGRALVQAGHPPPVELRKLLLMPLDC